MMMAVDESRPSLEERYVVAANSSHLELTEDGGPLDKMIAAGWINRHQLGTQLFRVKAEFDAVRGEMARAEEELAAQEERAGKIARSGSPTAAFDAKAVREEARKAALTARALVLVQLKTLDEAKQAVGNYARQMAERKGQGLPVERVNQIAGRALAVFLDPVCSPCEGRGFTGGYLAPIVWCKVCGNTGRRDMPGQKERPKEYEFGSALLADMERKLAGVSAIMARFLRRQ